MSELIRSITTRLRDLYDRRHSPRFRAQRKVRLLFSLSLIDQDASNECAYLRPLEGHTRDISTEGLGIVVPSLRIGEHYLTDQRCELRIVLLDLPSGQVEIHATPVRYEELSEDEADGQHLIGARITKISDTDRARLIEYLRTIESHT